MSDGGLSLADIAHEISNVASAIWNYPVPFDFLRTAATMIVAGIILVVAVRIFFQVLHGVVSLYQLIVARRTDPLENYRSTLDESDRGAT